MQQIYPGISDEVTELLTMLASGLQKGDAGETQREINRKSQEALDVLINVKPPHSRGIVLLSAAATVFASIAHDFCRRTGSSHYVYLQALVEMADIVYRDSLIPKGAGDEHARDKGATPRTH